MNFGFTMKIIIVSSFLVFEKKMANFSTPLLLRKKLGMYNRKLFDFHWIDVEDGKRKQNTIKVGDSVLIKRGLPHQLMY